MTECFLFYGKIKSLEITTMLIIIVLFTIIILGALNKTNFPVLQMD